MLKLVVYLLIGTLWIKFSSPVSWFGIIINALPLGVLAGVILVKQFEKHQADRKIWYAVLLIVGVMSYFAPAGVVI